MLAVEFIHKLISSGHQAIEELNKENHELTVLDIQRALGHLDCVEFDLEAAKCILRDELKMRKSKAK